MLTKKIHAIFLGSKQANAKNLHNQFGWNQEKMIYRLSKYMANIKGNVNVLHPIIGLLLLLLFTSCASNGPKKPIAPAPLSGEIATLDDVFKFADYAHKLQAYEDYHRELASLKKLETTALKLEAANKVMQEEEAMSIQLETQFRKNQELLKEKRNTYTRLVKTLLKSSYCQMIDEELYCSFSKANLDASKVQN